MTAPKSDRVYLRHILQAIDRIERYLDGVSEAEFMEDELRQDGVIRQLSIIGEAVKRLSDETRAEHPMIPWRDVAGMRDKLIHDYFGVDLEAVWDTATQDLTPLKREVQVALADQDT